MRKRTILFVDDEEKSRKYFKRIFRVDFRILLAADGREALSLFGERCHEIGMVVTDQIMPRVSGLELLRAIERSGPNVVRILSTAYTDSDLVAEAARDGVIDYLIIKPWDIERVDSILTQASAHFEHNERGTSKI
jgi:DNA-binding NtrC family response regulator